MSLLSSPIAGYHAISHKERSQTIAGSPYLALGSTGPEGINLSVSRTFQDITGDALGDTIVDQVYTGGNCVLEFVLQEIDSDAVRDFISSTRWTDNPSTTVPSHNEVGILGHLASSFAGVLKLTPVAGTSAADAHGGNSTRNFIGHVIDDFNETLDVKLNVVPIRFRCLPFVSSATGSPQVWWEWE